MSVKLEVVQKTLADRYEIERPLGHGGMATVFLATDKASGVPVALKVLRPEFAATLLADRFHQEIEFLATLKHPNILPLLESAEAGMLVYYVMPFAVEGSLKERLAGARWLGLRETTGIARDVAAGVGAAS